jgi:hypothetical protein
VTMVVAGDKNRDTDENQGGDQTTPPPSILPRQLLLDSIKTSVDFVPLISRGACCFRHKLRPPALIASLLDAAVSLTEYARIRRCFDLRNPESCGLNVGPSRDIRPLASAVFMP